MYEQTSQKQHLPDLPRDDSGYGRGRHRPEHHGFDQVRRRYFPPSHPDVRRRAGHGFGHRGRRLAQRKEIGALGGKAFIGFACTTLIAGTVGIIGANLVKPGSGIEYTGELTTEITGSEQTLTEIITNFFPNNIVSSIAEGNTIQVIVFALLAALAIVLPTIGLPIEGVALLSGIDWFSGMFRTTLNVIDDVLVALVVAKQEGEFDRQIFDLD